MNPATNTSDHTQVKTLTLLSKDGKKGQMSLTRDLKIFLRTEDAQIREVVTRNPNAPDPLSDIKSTQVLLENGSALDTTLSQLESKYVHLEKQMEERIKKQQTLLDQLQKHYDTVLKQLNQVQEAILVRADPPVKNSIPFESLDATESHRWKFNAFKENGRSTLELTLDNIRVQTFQEPIDVPGSPYINALAAQKHVEMTEKENREKAIASLETEQKAILEKAEKEKAEFERVENEKALQKRIEKALEDQEKREKDEKVKQEREEKAKQEKEEKALQERIEKNRLPDSSFTLTPPSFLPEKIFQPRVSLSSSSERLQLDPSERLQRTSSAERLNLSAFSENLTLATSSERIGSLAASLETNSIDRPLFSQPTPTKKIIDLEHEKPSTSLIPPSPAKKTRQGTRKT